MSSRQSVGGRKAVKGEYIETVCLLLSSAFATLSSGFIAFFVVFVFVRGILKSMGDLSRLFARNAFQ